MSEVDGKLHCNFNQNGTATYRLSSSKPNLQNVPFFLKEANLNLKALFIPDSDEYEIYDLDISNAEMRILCAYSLDAALIDAFHKGKDLHCLTGAGISNFDYDDLMLHKEDKESEQHNVRQIGKKVNFGTIFCMSAGKLQEQLWSELRIEISEQDAQEYLNKFFETYPSVDRYIKTTSGFAAIHGFTYTFTGRRRRFPLIRYQRGQISRAARQAVNARIQTTSSDLVTDNLVHIDRELVKPRHGRTLLTVHDSILFQLPKGETGVKADLDRIVVHDIAERYPWLPVSWAYDIGKGPSYGEAKYAVA
jgi:DNA polymerase-1